MEGVLWHKRVPRGLDDEIVSMVDRIFFGKSQSDDTKNIVDHIISTLYRLDLMQPQGEYL